MRVLFLLIGMVVPFCMFGQVIVSSNTICGSGTATLSVELSTGILNYEWSNGSTAASITVPAGFYYVKITKAGGVVDSLPYDLVTNPLPAPPIIALPASNQCASTVFSFSVSNYVSGNTYVWDFGDGTPFTTNNQTVNHVYNDINAIGNGLSPDYPVTVTSISPAGCSTVSPVQLFKVLQKPDASLSSTEDTITFNNLVCFYHCSINQSDYTFQFINNSSTTATDSIYIIKWGDASENDTLNSLGTFNHTYPVGIHLLELTVIGKNQCVNSVRYCVFTGSNPSTVTLQIPIQGSTICTGTPITFPIQGPGLTANAPGTIYTITFSDSTNSTPLIFSHPPPISITHTFNSSSCGEPDNSFSGTIEIINPCGRSAPILPSIYVSQKPAPTFTISPKDTICVDDILTLVNTSIDVDIVNGFGTCSRGKSFWKIRPTSGWNVTAGSLGNEFLPLPIVEGSSQVSIQFLNVGRDTIFLKQQGSQACGSDSISRIICVNPKPNPQFTLPTADICTGATMIISNTPTNYECGTGTYLWKITSTLLPGCLPAATNYEYVDGTDSLSEDPHIKFLSPGIYTILLNSYSPAKACNDTMTKVIQVNGTPNARIILPPYGCGVVSINPRDSSTDCGSVDTSYTWTFSGGSPGSSSSQDPGVISFNNPGVHPIQLVVKNGCGNDTADESVIVSPPPIINPTNDIIVCSGVRIPDIKFTASTGPANFSWTNSSTATGFSQLSGTDSINSFIATNTGNTPVTSIIIVTPTTGGSCIGISDTFSITVNPLPPPPAISTPVKLCQFANDSTLAVTNAQPTDTVKWYTSLPLNGGSPTPPTPSTVTPGVTLYYATITNVFGCRSDSSIVEVNIIPAFGGNSIGDSQTVCQGGSVTPLSGAVTGGSGTPAYIWQSSPNGINNWTITSITTADLTPTSLTDTIWFRRIVKNEAEPACPDTSNIILINVLPGLTNNRIDSNQTICEGLTPNLLVGELPMGGSGTFRYTWQNSIDSFATILTDSVADATGVNYQPPGLTTTTYFRRLTWDARCGALASNIITIKVNPAPVSTISAALSPICLNQPLTVNFTGTAGSPIFTATFNTNLPDGSNANLTPAISSNGPVEIEVFAGNYLPGIYTIQVTKLTDQNGCENLNLSPTVSIAVLTPIINKIKKDTTICDGQSFTIVSDSLYGGSAPGIDSLYSFQWETAPTSAGPWLLVTGANAETLSVSPSANSCYRRIVSSNNLPQCAVVSNVTSITVNPGIGNNLISDSQIVCVNVQPANLTGTAPTGGNGIYQFYWIHSTDQLNWDTVSNNINYQPPTSAIAGLHYYKRLIVSGNCTDESDVLTIAVKNNAEADFTATVYDTCARFVLDSFIQVNVLPDRNGTFSWFLNSAPFTGNPYSTGVFPGHTITTPGETDLITLVTKSPFGCLPDTISRRFSTFPTATANFTIDNRKGCGPILATITNTSSIINDSVSFSWNLGNGVLSNAVQPPPALYPTPTLPYDTTYHITLKAFNGCDTTTYIDSIVVRANPVAKFGVDTTFICSNAFVTITGNSLGRPDSSIWDFGDGNTLISYGSDTVIRHRYNVGQILTNFTITLIVINECKRDTQTIDIRVAPINIRPSVNINGTSQVGCIDPGLTGHTVIFNNGSTGATQYSWYFGDGDTLVTNNATPVVPHVYDTAGYFPVQIKMENFCPTDTVIKTWVRIFNKPIARFDLNNTVFCTGDSVKITSNNSLNSTRYVWNWGDASASVPGPIPPAHVYTSSGTYLIRLTAIIDTANISPMVCTDDTTITITVLNKPDVRIISNVVQCTRDTIKVAAPFVLTGETAEWRFFDNTGVVIISGTSAEYVYQNPGRYYVQLYVTNSNGCNDSSRIDFDIYPKPVAAMSPGSLQVCGTDTTIGFTNLTPAINATVFHNWSVNNVLQTNATVLTHRFLVPAGSAQPYSFNILLTESTAQGCVDTALTVLQMNPFPQSSFTLADTNACTTGYNALQANLSAYADSYQWFVNGTLFSRDSLPLIPVDSANKTYLIKLVTSNRYFCKNDTASRIFTSRLMPVAQFTFRDTLRCTDRLVSTINSSTFPPGSISNSYLWDWGDGTQEPAPRDTSHLFNNIGQYLVKLIISDGRCTDTATQRASVDIAPVINFSSPVTEVCDTARVQFTNFSTGAVKYTWHFGDGTTSDSTNPYKEYPPANTFYDVRLEGESRFGCKAASTAPVKILAKVPPAADFAIRPSPIIEIPKYSFTFDNQTLNSSKYTYQWTFGDGSYDSARNVTHLYPDTGTYAVRLIVNDNGNDCSDTVIKYVQIIGLPGHLYVPNAFYPNSPDARFSTFRPYGTGMVSYKMQIYDGWGKLLFETTKLTPEGAPAEGWDGKFLGKDLMQDAYLWRIEAYFKLGNRTVPWKGMKYHANEEPKHIGSITLIR